MIVGGSPEPPDGLSSRRLFFFFEAEELSGLAASLTDTLPEASTLTTRLLPVTEKLKVLVAE